jgi:protein SCO1/2
MNNRKTRIILIIFFLALTAAFMGYYYITAFSHKKSSLPVIGSNQNHHVHPFSFVNQDGKTVTENNMTGKICIVSYFFATCKGICPRMNENLSKVYEAYKGNKEVLILSHTVDPEKDTVAALKKYSLKFNADPGQWMFLTGSKKKLYNMARYSYLISAQDDTAGVSIDQDFIHDQHYVLLDRSLRIRGFYDGLDLKDVTKIITDIRSLLDE